MGGHFAVEVDGTLGGWLFSAEGGNPAAEVINEKVGPDHIAHKHIGGIKYDDLTVTCGAGMNRSFYQWIEKSFGMNAERKHGAATRTKRPASTPLRDESCRRSGCCSSSAT